MDLNYPRTSWRSSTHASNCVVSRNEGVAEVVPSNNVHLWHCLSTNINLMVVKRELETIYYPVRIKFVRTLTCVTDYCEHPVLRSACGTSMLTTGTAKSKTSACRYLYRLGNVIWYQTNRNNPSVRREDIWENCSFLVYKVSWKLTKTTTDAKAMILVYVSFHASLTTGKDPYKS